MSLCAVRGLAFLWTDPNFKEDSELSPVERTIKRTLEHIFDDRAEAEGKIAPAAASMHDADRPTGELATVCPQPPLSLSAVRRAAPNCRCAVCP